MSHRMIHVYHCIKHQFGIEDPTPRAPVRSAPKGPDTFSSRGARIGTSLNKKYITRRKGGAIETLDVPRITNLERNEVLIHVKAVAVNPADCKMIDQGHRGTTYPLVAGLDGAGIVEALGSNVSEFELGDEVVAVFAPGDRGGSYQDYAVVEARKVAKKPASWSFEDAASLAVCYFTAVMGLGIGLQAPLPFIDDAPRDGCKPASVLVLGGSSALGAATIQLLRLAVPSCRIVVTSSPRHHGHLTSYLGADAAVDRNSHSLVADIRSSTPGGKGVDAIIDAVGAGSGHGDIFDVFDPDGPSRYAQVWTGEDEVEVPEAVESVLFRSRDFEHLQGGDNIMLGLQKLLEQGRYKLPLPVRKVGQGLDGLSEGLEEMRKGVSAEKLVVSL